VKTLSAIASICVLAVTPVGCGDLARDVIIEKALVTDAGAVEDASPSPPYRETNRRCDRDAGCARCDPGVCSLACPLGCNRRDPGGSQDDYRPRSSKNASSYRWEYP
jgi:hypothetical protein